MHSKLLKHFFLGIFLVLSFLTNPIKANNNDELYQSRLAALKTSIEVNYHPAVRTYIEQYLANPELVKSLISRSKLYFPPIEKSLKQKNLPIDLKYIAAAASGLDPITVNTNGNSGVWTMSYAVAKMYKLKQNTYIDERRDLVKSSLAAAQHLKDLFAIYKSWPLAIAAYGCSPVQLNKGIHAAGNSFYFWDIYKVMPASCRDLYPKVIATVYILNYYKEHSIRMVEPLQLPVSDTVWVSKWLSFQQISTATSVPIEVLRDLNPVFKKDIIPFSQEPYFLRIPADKVSKFSTLRDTVYRQYHPIEIQPIAIEKDTTEVAQTPVESNHQESKANKQTNTRSLKPIKYTIKKGDILTDIADWFDVSVYDLKAWNPKQTKRGKVKRGLVLKIYVQSNKTGYYRRINSMSMTQKKRLKRRD
jgi:membrane-bound lytic murein transglycosylase D